MHLVFTATLFKTAKTWEQPKCRGAVFSRRAVSSEATWSG